MLLKTILGHANNQNVSAAVTVPAGLVNVLLDMSLTAEKTMQHLEEMIDKLNTSVDTKIMPPNCLLV
ncbi:hypothetical protein VP01_4181g1 [Puccinia sorghi]|uniref:Uncharacterized protein n=1 Tax=Puccinia sorghi TaxID=27349 RepID=A0A0L6URQ6_9BASI|nr:hypothetical protein VP01_4181g1 [Puccinia sorghi]